MAGVRGKFAPAVTRQQPIDSRQCAGPAHPGLNGRFESGDDDNAACVGIGKHLIKNFCFERQVSMGAVAKLPFVPWHGLDAFDDAPESSSHAASNAYRPANDARCLFEAQALLQW